MREWRHSHPVAEDVLVWQVVEQVVGRVVVDAEALLLDEAL